MEKGVSQKAEDFLIFQLNRNIINLYKSFLIILEDLQESPYNIPEETRLRLRKKVLDSGNDALRELETYISKFKFALK
ncbi:MAG: hypothetical protein AABY22_09985 [Nanoarchaeota archaeon]